MSTSRATQHESVWVKLRQFESICRAEYGRDAYSEGPTCIAITKSFKLLMNMVTSVRMCIAELNTGVMLLRNTDWTRQFIDDVARLGKMHVNHWQLMDQVSLPQTSIKIH